MTWLLVVLCMLLPCCGGQLEGSGSTSLEASCTRFAAARASYLACLESDEAESLRPATVASCVGIVTSSHSTLTAIDVDACAAELGAWKCGDDRSGPSCAGMSGDMLFPNHDRAGTGAPGASCSVGVQCASGHCSGSFGTCGICQALRSLGERCTTATDACAEGSCSGGVCELDGLGLGERCVDYGGGGCREGLYCLSTHDVFDGVCVRAGDLGAACDAQHLCADRRYCAEGVCAALPAPAIELPEGADCSGGRCDRGLICDEGTCRPVLHRSRGEACDGARYRCGPGTACNLCSSTGECGRWGVCVGAGDGDPCAGGGGCASNFRCEGFSPPEAPGTCRRLGDEGASCPCSADLLCRDGRCRAYGDAACR